MHTSEEPDTIINESAENNPKIEFNFHFTNGQRGCKQIRKGEALVTHLKEPGRIPRVSRFMALAIHFEELLHRGEMQDYVNLAQLGHVSRPRITQIMNFLQLAPDIQEEILFLPRTKEASDLIIERDIRPILVEADWEKQRQMWIELKK